MSKRRQLGQVSEDVKINISPLIDCVFILLIFFIVTTIFVEERGLSANTPSMDAKPATDQELLSFRITGTGQVLFRGRDVGLSGVRVTVLNYIQQEKAPVIIEVEDDAPAGIMVRVMDEAQYAGAEEISVKPASN